MNSDKSRERELAFVELLAHESQWLESLWRKSLKDPVFFAREILGVNPHSGQRKWLRRSNSRQNLLVTGNRWGKSFVGAIKALHRAIFQVRDSKYDTPARYRIVVASITQNQAGIIWNYALSLARKSVASALIRDVTHTPFPKITFGNGSEIEARSTQNRGEYLLGNDYDYFIFDEVAFESSAEYVVEEVIMMRLADRRGELDLVSTPNGKNWFYQKMRDLADNPEIGYAQIGDTRENPFVSREYINQRIELFSPQRVAQNIMGVFVDSGREIVGSDYVDAALKRDADYETPDKLSDDKIYFISGWDLARKRTATVGITVAVRRDGFARVVAVERFQEMEWNFVFEKIRMRQRNFPGRVVLDATGLGDVVIAELRDVGPIPFLFNEKSKAELLTNLEMFHVRKHLAYERFEIADKNGRVWSLEDELRGATWDENTKCDGMMALALALWPLRDVSRIRRVDARVASF
ncbi:MAG: hypothetical protein IIB00_00660 [candidate division Zixibacteria bacterium]|nr:hypothetical protein [candidate division Zixibacteria bacterium]